MFHIIKYILCIKQKNNLYKKNQKSYRQVDSPANDLNSGFRTARYR